MIVHANLLSIRQCIQLCICVCARATSVKQFSRVLLQRIHYCASTSTSDTLGLASTLLSVQSVKQSMNPLTQYKCGRKRTTGTLLEQLFPVHPQMKRGTRLYRLRQAGIIAMLGVHNINKLQRVWGANKLIEHKRNFAGGYITLIQQDQIKIVSGPRKIHWLKE